MEMTPDALERSVAKGTYRKVRVGDLAKTSCDEIFHGAAIYCALREKDAPLSRADLQKFVEPTMHRYFNRILTQWNKNHKDRPIRHNGRNTSYRRYSL